MWEKTRGEGGGTPKANTQKEEEKARTECGLSYQMMKTIKCFFDRKLKNPEIKFSLHHFQVRTNTDFLQVNFL